MYPLTIFQPAYRIENWDRYIQSITNSCTRYSHQIVFCGPKEPINSLPPNCKFILDKGSPARCSNIAVQNSDGNLILLGSDDAIFLPGLLDELLDFYYSWTSINDNNTHFIVPIRYGEANTWMQEEYWKLHHHPTLRIAGVPDHILTLNILCCKDYWIGIGGYDCELFNTCNWGGHDLNLRFLKDGAIFSEFKKHLMMCDWDCGGKDHSPMVESEKGDYTRFCEIYNIPNNRIRIDINNWQKTPDIWPYASLRGRE